MANTDIRKGLVPVDHMLISGFKGRARPYYIPSTYATALFVGDPVIVTGTANTALVQTAGCKYRAGMLQEINKATAGDGNPIAGVIVGFDLPVNGASPYAAPYSVASSAAVAFVVDDPYVIFEIQADSANAVAATDISSNANVVYTHSGNTTTGLSGAELNTASMTTTASFQLRIMELVNREDNELGTNAKLRVTINNHFYMKEEAGI